MKYIPVNLKQKKVTSKGTKYAYWVLRYTDVDGKPKMEHIGRVDRLSDRQATLLRSRRESEINDPEFREQAPKKKLKAFLEEYIESRKAELAAGTLELHKTTKKYLLAFFDEDGFINKITKRNAREFKTALANGDLKHASMCPRDLKESTVDMHMRNARTIFNQAVEDELIPTNPFSKLCRSQAVEKQWHYVTPGEFKKLFETAPSLNWRVLLSLCRFAGLRRSEAMQLEWCNIDFEEKTLEIISKKHWKTKTRKARKIPMMIELQNILTEAHAAARTGQAKVLEWSDGVSLWQTFHVIRKHAKVDRYEDPFHAMRKSCSLDWANNGIPPHTLKEWMGHSKFETTMRYYLKVSKSEYEKGSNMSFYEVSGQNSEQTNNKKDLTKKEDERICL